MILKIYLAQKMVFQQNNNIGYKILKKTAIITGASSGIGKSLSYKLAKENFNIVLASRNFNQLKKIAEEINLSNGTALSVKTDITDIQSCQNLIAKTINEFGQIDYLILNAGLSMWSRYDEIKDIYFFTNDTSIEHFSSQEDIMFFLNTL